jgi:hypothetical protein
MEVVIIRQKQEGVDYWIKSQREPQKRLSDTNIFYEVLNCQKRNLWKWNFNIPSEDMS